MLRDLQAILDRKPKLDEEAFQKAANRLLNRQFIYRNGHGEREAYLLVTDHRTYFKHLFEALGFDLIVDEQRDFVGILPHQMQRRLSLEETTLLLVLRHIYEDEIVSCRAESEVVEIDWETLLVRYEELSGRQLSDHITAFRSTLKPLKRYGVLDLQEPRDDSELPLIRILPAITALISRELLDELLGEHPPAAESSPASETDELAQPRLAAPAKEENAP